MSRRLYRWLVFLTVLCGIDCAPRDSAPTGTKDQSQRDSELVVPPPKTLELPKAHRDRIDAALANIRNRDLLPEHGFWTFFHAILGVGPEHAMFFDSRTGKRGKALDYICQGGEVRGMTFDPLSADRVDVVTMAGSGLGQGHQDQFIAEMAQWNMPRDKKFRVKGKDYTFEAFIRHAKDRASVKANQELSWAIIIVAQYYGTHFTWINDHNERIRFEEMVRYEMTQPIKESPVCGGSHRLFGLTWAYHLHMAGGGKQDEVWQDVAKLTREYMDLAKKLQNEDGSFSTDYFRGPANQRNDLQRRIHSTGHVLEWLALALSEEELRQAWMENAADALVRMILEHRDEGLEGGALYHAAHGLEIYRTRLFGSAHSYPPMIPPPPKAALPK